MQKGIIYIMSTAVPGLIKIGKTGSLNFENRMYELEHNGYRNVTSLNRTFAIEVDDYDDKEKMLHTIFEKSQVSDTELFALDINIATQLLSSFEGKIIYPQEETKKEIFEEAISNSKTIPDGKYYLAHSGNLKAEANIKNGEWIIKKGSYLKLVEKQGCGKNIINKRKAVKLDNTGKLLEDYNLGKTSPSTAASFVRFASTNGWDYWKTKDNQSINIYRD